MLAWTVQVVVAGRPAVPLPPGVRRVVVTPTPDAPTGRYGAALVAAWAACPPTAPGLIVVEHDLAVDPRHWHDLAAAIQRAPTTVWAVPYRLWPTSTGRATGVWAHRDAARQFVPVTQPCPRVCGAVGLGCTYWPGALLDAVADELATWVYPAVDDHLSAWAVAHGWRLRTTRREAIHLHWGGADGTAWTY